MPLRPMLPGELESQYRSYLIGEWARVSRSVNDLLTRDDGGDLIIP